MFPFWHKSSSVDLLSPCLLIPSARHGLLISFKTPWPFLKSLFLCLCISLLCFLSLPPAVVPNLAAQPLSDYSRQSAGDISIHLIPAPLLKGLSASAQLYTHTQTLNTAVLSSQLKLDATAQTNKLRHRQTDRDQMQMCSMRSKGEGIKRRQGARSHTAHTNTAVWWVNVTAFHMGGIGRWLVELSW